MTPEQIIRIGSHAAQAVLSARDGDAVGVAVHALDAVLEAIDGNVTEARELLDQAAIRRANRIVDELERAKFGDG